MARTNSDILECRQPQQKVPCCPDCGALECLCRPRFFAGQLLSEQDMNRLDQYIKNKNRLHNRNQHGWGVVNGLLVVCDPCGEIKVTQGYAVDPCGDDIVVCEDTTVNICELIRKCKQADHQPECEPFRRPPNTHCDELEEEWVLTIQYREWASRGVTALRGNTCATGACLSCGSHGGCNCGSGCSCGSCGGRAGACTCGNGKSASAPRQNGVNGSPKNRGAPPQCEATVTCEGYSFGVYKKPENEDSDDDDRLFRLTGAFWEAFKCCAQPLVDAIPPMPEMNDDNNQPSPAALSQWCCRFRDNLLKYFRTHRNTSCEIIDYLHAVNCPNANSSDTYSHDFTRSFLQLLSAWAEGIKNCFCLSLLPPPPQASCDVRVPLATVRIRARDCRILSICNWTTERKIMISWPAVSYWLGIVPIGDFIREMLDRLCCSSLLDVFDGVIKREPEEQPQGGRGATNSIMRANTEASVNQPQDMSFGKSMHMASGSAASRFRVDLGDKINSFALLADGVIGRGNEPLELGAVLNALSPRFKLPDNGMPLNSIEAKNIPLLLISEVAVKPVLSSVLGSSRAAARVEEYQRNLSSYKGTARPASAESSNAELQRQMDDMRLKLEQQESQIKKLQKNQGK